MATCSHCNAATQLHVYGVPLCIKCANALEAKEGTIERKPPGGASGEPKRIVPRYK